MDSAVLSHLYSASISTVPIPIPLTTREEASVAVWRDRGRREVGAHRVGRGCFHRLQLWCAPPAVLLTEPPSHEMHCRPSWTEATLPSEQFRVDGPVGGHGDSSGGAWSSGGSTAAWVALAGAAAVRLWTCACRPATQASGELWSPTVMLSRLKAEHGSNSCCCESMDELWEVGPEHTAPVLLCPAMIDWTVPLSWPCLSGVTQIFGSSSEVEESAGGFLTVTMKRSLVFRWNVPLMLKQFDRQASHLRPSCPQGVSSVAEEAGRSRTSGNLEMASCGDPQCL